MTELRVSELATKAGVSVRNIRAYQDRGLLPPPRRTGRIVWYNDQHVERLAVITKLLDRGFSMANIGELLAGWQEGNTIADVVGLEHRISGTFSDEQPDLGTPGEIIERYGLTPDDASGPGGAQALRSFDKSIEHGLIEVDGDRWRVPSPRLLRAGVELRRAGVPFDELIAELRNVRSAMEAIAEQMVELVHHHVWGPHLTGGLPPLPEVIEVADVVDRIRPAATTVVMVELARALQEAADRHVRATIDKLVTQ